VAVKTCPLIGAVADDTLTVVVAEFKPFAAAAVPDVFAALLGMSPLASARKLGAPDPEVGPANT
jgi:hypothetical protein